MTRIVLTYDDLAALPAGGLRYERYELHEGEIFVTASPRTRHQEVVGNLYLILAEHVRTRGIGKVFISPIDVILTNTTVLVPDLVYVDRARLAQVSGRGIEGAPTLVIEVLSPTTAVVDQGVKLTLYARYGVPHHWLVDADARVIETRELTGADYTPGPRLEGATPRALPPFADLALDPAVVWR